MLVRNINRFISIIIIIIILLFWEFFTPALADGFHWSLRDSKSLQASRTLLRILTDFNNSVVWMVSTYSLISKSSCFFTNPLRIIPSSPITSGITVTFMIHFSSPLRRSKCLSLFSFSFFYCVIDQDGNVHYLASSSPFFFFFFFWLLLGLIVWPRLCDLCVYLNHRELCASHSLGRILGCAYTTCSYGQI